MFIINKIAQLLAERKLNQNDLLSFLGIKRRATFTEWKKGENKSYIKHLPKIAEFFNVPISYFYDNNTSIELSQNETDLLNTYRSLSINGKRRVDNYINKIADVEISEEYIIPTCIINHSVFKVSAGIGVEIDQEQMEPIEVLRTAESAKADFCLTIKGDSMSPVYNDGDIILVKAQPAVDMGQICVYNINNNGYIKKFGGDKLISLNPKFKDVMIPTEGDNIVKCCGLVIGKAVII